MDTSYEPILEAKNYCAICIATFLCGWIFFMWIASAVCDCCDSQQSGHFSILFNACQSEKLYLSFCLETIFWEKRILQTKIILKISFHHLIKTKCSSCFVFLISHLSTKGSFLGIFVDINSTRKTVKVARIFTSGFILSLRGKWLLSRKRISCIIILNILL